MRNPDPRGTANATVAVSMVGQFAMLAVATAASIGRFACLLSTPLSRTVSALTVIGAIAGRLPTRIFADPLPDLPLTASCVAGTGGHLQR